jgi:hypothetical protein
MFRVPKDRSLLTVEKHHLIKALKINPFSFNDFSRAEVDLVIGRAVVVVPCYVG